MQSKQSLFPAKGNYFLWVGRGNLTSLPPQSPKAGTACNTLLKRPVCLLSLHLELVLELIQMETDHLQSKSLLAWHGLQRQGKIIQTPHTCKEKRDFGATCQGKGGFARLSRQCREAMAAIPVPAKQEEIWDSVCVG